MSPARARSKSPGRAAAADAAPVPLKSPTPRSGVAVARREPEPVNDGLWRCGNVRVGGIQGAASGGASAAWRDRPMIMKRGSSFTTDSLTESWPSGPSRSLPQPRKPSASGERVEADALVKQACARLRDIAVRDRRHPGARETTNQPFGTARATPVSTARTTRKLRRSSRRWATCGARRAG